MKFGLQITRFFVGKFSNSIEISLFPGISINLKTKFSLFNLGKSDFSTDGKMI